MDCVPVPQKTYAGRPLAKESGIGLSDQLPRESCGVLYPRADNDSGHLAMVSENRHKPSVRLELAKAKNTATADAA